MGLKEDCYIRPIPYDEAMQVVVKNHYLHRKPPCSYAFGLFNTHTHTLCGCVTYGCPPSRSLQRGICGDEEADNVIELNRLWISEDLPRNAASYLVSHTIKQLPYEIVVSFADTGVGHVGYIYQATNFLYTGHSAERVDWHIEGLKVHPRSISHKGDTLESLKERYGDAFGYQRRSSKNRYIYFNAKGKRKEQLIGKLRYKVQPYPKGDAKKVEVNRNAIDTQMTLDDFIA